MTPPSHIASCFLLLSFLPLSAQTAAPALSLSLLESTYQAELKKIHVPLIGNYVNDLQRLAAVSRNAETTVAINEELRRMQDIINTGGVMNLELAATAETIPVNAAKTTAPPANLPAARILITLVPTLADTISPNPAPSATLESVPFTKIRWTIEALPRGSYELVAQCSVQSLEDAASLQVRLDRKQLDLPIQKRHLAATPDDFRLLRLGRLELPLDIKDSTLELLVSPSSARADVRLRQLFITRAPPPSSQPSPLTPPQP